MKAKLLLGIFAVGLLVMNFTVGRNPVRNENLTLKNISLIQANAGELACMPDADEECVIIYGDYTLYYRGRLAWLEK